MSKKVYIFGAGASAASGLPIQTKILETIFSLVPEQDEDFYKNIDLLGNEDDFGNSLIDFYGDFESSRRYLAGFIITYFGNDTLRKKYTPISLDIGSIHENIEEWSAVYHCLKAINISLEDIFTFLDKSSILNEYFGPYSDQDLANIQKCLSNCIIYILANGILKSRSVEKFEIFNRKVADFFVSERLKYTQEYDPFSIISLNWDTLLDYYLYKSCKEKSTEFEILPDYCCYNYDVNLETTSTLIKAKGKYNLKLLKLHGSINWLFCPNCGRLKTNYVNNISLQRITNGNHNGYKFVACEYCDSNNRKYVFKDMIITPTFLKDLNNLHLKTIWHNAYLDLCEANEVIFLGYSLPDADFELRYILKKAINQNTKVKVVLRSSDDMHRVGQILNQISDSDERNLITGKLSSPTARYNDFFQNHCIEFDFDGIESFFDKIKEV